MHGQDAASTLLSIRDAALATGLSPKALRRRIERGTLSSVLIGGRRRIPTEDLIRHGLMSGRARWAPVDGPEPTGELVAALVRRLDVLEGRVARLESNASLPPAPDVARMTGPVPATSGSRDAATGAGPPRHTAPGTERSEDGADRAPLVAAAPRGQDARLPSGA